MTDQPPVSIGIDLGTTNSVAAYCDGQQVRILGVGENEGLLPSVFSYQYASADEETGQILVGVPAVQNWKAAPEETVFCIKRLMGRWHNDELVRKSQEAYPYRIVQDDSKQAAVLVGGKKYTPAEVSAHYLAKLRRRAELELGRTVDSAVITVPAYFEERQRKATREAGELAGLRVKKIIDEPTAAAIAFGIDATQRHTLMVFDLGGGTFDVSLLHLTKQQQTGQIIFHVTEIDGDNWLGGSDFDQRVIDYIVQDFEQRHKVNTHNDPEFLALVRQEVERRKIDLSETDEVFISMPAAYRDGQKTLSLNMQLTRDKFEKLIRDDVERAVFIAQRALKTRSLRPEDLTAVLLVGGSTKVPLVRQRMIEVFGEQRTRFDFNPMTIVAQGAAVLADRLKGIECLNPQCGEVRKVKLLNSQKEIEVRDHHINDESRETCEKCGASLASARSATQGIDVREPMARSVGILAVEGERKNAFVCLIKKNEPYPLAQPVEETFYPHANTKVLHVPVFEAEDNEGTGRNKQGSIVCKLDETITNDTPVKISFNVDRNRIVTVSMKMEGRDPVVKSLDLEAPPDAKGQGSWLEELRWRILTVRTFIERYQKYIDPIRLDELNEHLKKAEKVRNTSEPGQRPTREGERVLLVARNAVVESGPAATLFLADIVWEDAVSETKAKIEEAKKELMDIFHSQPELRQQKSSALMSLLANVRAAGRASAEGEVEIDPNELLEKK